MTPIKLKSLLSEFVFNPVPLEAGIHKIPMKAFAWFNDKEPLVSAKLVHNIVELRQRLTWLSEGSLHYHLEGGKYGGPEGNPAEKALYAQFRRYLAGMTDNTV